MRHQDQQIQAITQLAKEIKKHNITFYVRQAEGSRFINEAQKESHVDTLNST